MALVRITAIIVVIMIPDSVAAIYTLVTLLLFAEIVTSVVLGIFISRSNQLEKKNMALEAQLAELGDDYNRLKASFATQNDILVSIFALQRDTAQSSIRAQAFDEASKELKKQRGAININDSDVRVGGDMVGRDKT